MGRARPYSGVSNYIIAGSIVFVRTGVPVRANLLGLCGRGYQPLRDGPRRVDGLKAGHAMPSAWWVGLRSCALANLCT
jgi:hypothetical protein